MGDNTDRNTVIVCGYLVVGSFYSLFTSTTSLVDFVINTLLWLPIVLFHWLYGLVVTILIAGLVLWAVSSWFWPDLGKAISYGFNKLWK